MEGRRAAPAGVALEAVIYYLQEITMPPKFSKEMKEKVTFPDWLELSAQNLAMRGQLSGRQPDPEGHMPC